MTDEFEDNRSSDLTQRASISERDHVSPGDIAGDACRSALDECERCRMRGLSKPNVTISLTAFVEFSDDRA